MNYISKPNIIFLGSALVFFKTTMSLFANPVTGWVTVYGDARYENQSEKTNSPQTTNAQSDVFMANFPGITLNQGDSIHLSGSVTIVGTQRALPQRQLRWGFFHSPEAPQEKQSSNYVGIWATTRDTGPELARADGSAQHPFSSKASTNISHAIDDIKGIALYNKPLSFSISAKRISPTEIQTSAMITDNDGYFTKWPETNSPASPANFTFNCAGFLAGSTIQKESKALFSNIIVTTTRATQAKAPSSNPKKALGFFLLGVDFNSIESSEGPTQPDFRELSGKMKTAVPIHQQIGSIGTSLSTADNSPIEFHGANGDETRSVPIGDTTRTALVADFTGSRSAPLEITLRNLRAGTYRWISHHLEPMQKGGLGYASGKSATSPNTIQAHLGSQLQGSVTPTSLSPAGLDKRDIADSDIPNLNFVFSHDGSGPITIKLSSTDTDGSNRHIFLNGFELYEID